MDEITARPKIYFFIALIIFVALDFFVERHPYFTWEGIPGFFAVYGFISCVLIVAVSKLFGKLFLQKKEGYYE